MSFFIHGLNGNDGQLKSLNVGKTHFMILISKKKKIENQEIEHTCKTKFLGVIIEQKLTLKPHMALMSGKIAKGIGLIIKARYCLNKYALLTLFFIHIPIFDLL